MAIFPTAGEPGGFGANLGNSPPNLIDLADEAKGMGDAELDQALQSGVPHLWLFMSEKARRNKVREKYEEELAKQGLPQTSILQEMVGGGQPGPPQGGPPGGLGDVMQPGAMPQGMGPQGPPMQMAGPPQGPPMQMAGPPQGQMPMPGYAQGGLVRGYSDGGLAEIEDWGDLGREAFKTVIFDPEDPWDYAAGALGLGAAATAGLSAVPGGAIWLANRARKVGDIARKAPRLAGHAWRLARGGGGTPKWNRRVGRFLGVGRNVPRPQTLAQGGGAGRYRAAQEALAGRELAGKRVLGWAGLGGSVYGADKFFDWMGSGEEPTPPPENGDDEPTTTPANGDDEPTTTTPAEAPVSQGEWLQQALRGAIGPGSNETALLGTSGQNGADREKMLALLAAGSAIASGEKGFAQNVGAGGKAATDVLQQQMLQNKQLQVEKDRQRGSLITAGLRNDVERGLLTVREADMISDAGERAFLAVLKESGSVDPITGLPTMGSGGIPPNVLMQANKARTAAMTRAKAVLIERQSAVSGVPAAAKRRFTPEGVRKMRGLGARSGGAGAP